MLTLATIKAMACFGLAGLCYSAAGEQRSDFMFIVFIMAMVLNFSMGIYVGAFQ